MKSKYDKIEYTVFPTWSDIVGYLLLVILFLISVIYFI